MRRFCSTMVLAGCLAVMAGGSSAWASVVGHGYDVSVASTKYGNYDAEAGFLPAGQVVSLVGVDTEDGPDYVGVYQELVGSPGPSVVSLSVSFVVDGDGTRSVFVALCVDINQSAENEYKLLKKLGVPGLIWGVGYSTGRDFFLFSGSDNGAVYE